MDRPLFAALAPLTIAIFSAAPAHATEAPVLAPSTPWKVDYAKEECRLLRTFGSGEDAVTMRLARGSGMQSFDMVIAGAQIPQLGDDVKITMRLEPQADEASFDGYSMAVPKRPEKFIRWYDGSPEILAKVTNAQLVRLTADDHLDVAMLWSDGRAALAALQACHDDLLKSWGVKVEEIRALKVPPEPIGSPGRWATNADYPSKEMQREVQGTVTFQLMVNTAGIVESCLILLSSNSAVLDERSCSLMRQRAKFKPARDANDQPVISYYINRIRWQIPR